MSRQKSFGLKCPEAEPFSVLTMLDFCEDGVIAYHVSNRYLDLPPLLGRLGREQGLIVRVDEDFAGEAAALGKSSSTWVVLARSEPT